MFIVGRVVGVGSVGFYALAMELATLVSTEIVMPVRRAVFPGFAKLQDDTEEFRLRFALGTASLLAISAPVAAGAAALADPVLGMLFPARPEWGAAADPMRVLALYGLAYAAAGFCWSVIVAKGEPKAMTPVLLISIAVGAPLIWAGGAFIGLTGAAIGATAGMSVYAGLMLRAGMRLTGCSVRQLFSPAPRILAAASASGVVGYMIAETLAHPAAAFFAGGSGLLLTYGVLLLALWKFAGAPDGPEARFIALLQTRLNRQSLKTAE